MNIDYFASHIDYITSFLHLSFHQIKDKLNNNPIYLVEYIGENEQKKFRSTDADTTDHMVCSFGEDDICDFISLYAKESDVKNFFSQRIVDYDFIKNQLALRICYVETKELKEQICNVCLVFY